MANKISTVFEFSERGNGLKKIRADVDATEGSFGKMKTASKGAFDSIKQYGPEIAAVVGGAVVTAAYNAGQEFADAAVEVGRFSDATGLSNEEASKWVSVADDLGINVGDVEKAFYRLNKEIGEGDGVAEEYGIELKRTADGAADVNGTMLETIDVINGIKDPTERARVAQELFGRSYANVAEIIFNDADKVREALESTSEAQIFDQDEVDKAREYRAAMDRFNDVLVDLKYTIGEGVVPVLTDAANAAVDFKEAVEAIPGVPKAVQLWWDNASPQAWIGHVASGWSAVGGALGLVSDEAPEASRWVEETANKAILAAEAVDQEAEAHRAAVDALRASADEATYNADAHDEMRRIQREVNDAVEAATAAQEDYLDSIKHTRDEVGKLKRDIDDEQAWISMQEAFERTDQTLNNVESSARDNRSAVLDLKEEVLLYGESLNLPDEVITQLVAMVEAGALAEVEAMLARWGNGVTLPIRPVIIKTGGSSSIRVDENGNVRGIPGRASGGPVSAGQTYLVGEKGPELLTMGGSGYVTPNKALASAGTSGGVTIGSVVVQAPAGANADEFGRLVWEAIRRETRWRGPVGGIAA